jgi:hypothetical protein
MDIDGQDVRMRGLNDYEENDDETFDRGPSKIQRRHMNDSDDDDDEEEEEDEGEEINGDRSHSRKPKVRPSGHDLLVVNVATAPATRTRRDCKPVLGFASCCGR